jgi:hypothetical protein
MKQAELTFERASALLSYDAETGAFHWKVSRRGRHARPGAKAGTLDRRGRWVIAVDGKRHHASRLAFLLTTQRHPAEMIDHKNGDCSDDRWSNLREATPQQNQANRKATAASGLKGAHYWAARGKWRAFIKVDQKQRSLGVFETAEAAHAAYCAAATEAFGAYARFQ